MNVKTVSVTYERKLNLGDYNSATIGASAWADLDDGEDPVAAYEALYAMVKEMVKEQALPLVRRQQARVAEAFSGVPIAETSS